jgi:HK97 family phage major capsid protein
LTRRGAMPDVGYMFHDSILKGLRKLKDGMGRYLWQAGANTGAPDVLNTYPYTINQDMQSSFATGTKTILFGQFSQYKIRQVATMRMYRLQERYRDNDQDGFIAFTEGDGNLLDAGDHPVKYLIQA